MANPPTVDDLQRQITDLKQELIGCIQGMAKARRQAARGVVVGMALSGAVCGIVGYLLGSRQEGQ